MTALSHKFCCNAVKYLTNSINTLTINAAIGGESIQRDMAQKPKDWLSEMQHCFTTPKLELTL